MERIISEHRLKKSTVCVPCLGLINLGWSFFQLIAGHVAFFSNGSPKICQTVFATMALTLKNFSGACANLCVKCLYIHFTLTPVIQFCASQRLNGSRMSNTVKQKPNTRLGLDPLGQSDSEAEADFLKFFPTVLIRHASRMHIVNAVSYVSCMKYKILLSQLSCTRAMMTFFLGRRNILFSWREVFLKPTVRPGLFLIALLWGPILQVFSTPKQSKLAPLHYIPGSAANSLEVCLGTRHRKNHRHFNPNTKRNVIEHEHKKMMSPALFIAKTRQVKHGEMVAFSNEKSQGHCCKNYLKKFW